VYDQSSNTLTLPQAVKEADGRISYMQLYRGIRSGRIEAFQPSGAFGHYSIKRNELDRVCAPTKGQE